MSGKKDKLGRKGAPAGNIDRAKLEAMAAKLGRSKSMRKLITWPGGTAQMELRVLSVDEIRVSDAEALVEVQEQLGDSSVPRNISMNMLQTAQAKHAIARACMVVGQDEKFFDSPAELGAVSSEYELFAVFKEYQAHVEEVDPDIEELSEEQLEIVVEAVKKKDASLLRSIASDLRRNSLLTLVGLLATSLEDNSTNT